FVTWSSDCALFFLFVIMSKVLITGASGLLGRAIVNEFLNNSWEVLGLAFSRARDKLIKVDLNNLDEVKEIIQKFKPTVIIHCAAQRSVEKVEKDYEESKRLNVACSKNLADLASNVYVHILSNTSCLLTRCIFLYFKSFTDL
ncbi:methionine adenosyltransferase 2 subunit beta-like, partial [Stegodyphus dumicola]|uniref:methionine adenosyltransferase 2 subunit beta-like n=1 Tax=Stegodyphus dumicola TaxID=202533 RepID=UPI0015B3116B